MRYLYCLLLLLAGTPYTMAQTDEKTSVLNEMSTSNEAYLVKDWSNGVVRFSGGRILTEPKLRFNCVQNLLMLQFKGTEFAAQGKIVEFVLYVKRGKTTDSMLFRKEYPAIDQQNSETYYQVLTSGKATLLKLHLKVLREERSIIGGSNVNRKLEDDKAYYLLKDNTMILLPQERNKIAEKFGDQSVAIAQFINMQQLKMHTDEDLIAVVKKYNEL